MKGTIRIGGASGYWGDAGLATPQLLSAGGLDFIVYDYLAEITMGILARARARDDTAGYATDFVTAAMAPNLPAIAAQGVRIIANAGGVNPLACAAALRAAIAKAGLGLKVAVVEGDDLMASVPAMAADGTVEMFTGAAFPDPAKVASANAYLGAFPIAAALNSGADIVITGRCVDSAVTLGACIHAFGWTADQLDLLAAGSLAGHIIECGTQATGGNFTDWREVADGLATCGYPIAEIGAVGAITVTKPEGTGGKVSKGTVAEQILYEIGDPAAYVLPDVVCDFSDVTVRQTAPDRVTVEGARGIGVPDSLKASVIFEDGWRGGHSFTFYGLEADDKARHFAETAIARARAALRAANAPDFDQVSIEVIGAEDQFGAARSAAPAREVGVKIAVRHPMAQGVGALLREATGLGLAAPPGLSGFAGARPKPSSVMALFSCMVPKAGVQATVTTDDGTVQTVAFAAPVPATPPTPAPPAAPHAVEPMTQVPLIRLAWARSGDKGDAANIGVIARDAAYMPWIWAGLNEDHIRETFAHFLQGDIARYPMPGLPAMNIVLTSVLGGGGMASLRNDPQGKGYAQLLLARTIPVPAALAEDLA